MEAEEDSVAEPSTGGAAGPAGSGPRDELLLLGVGIRVGGGTPGLSPSHRSDEDEPPLVPVLPSGILLGCAGLSLLSPCLVTCQGTGPSAAAQPSQHSPGAWGTLRDLDSLRVRECAEPKGTHKIIDPTPGPEQDSPVVPPCP